MKTQPLRLQERTAAKETDSPYGDRKGAPKRDLLKVIVQPVVTPYRGAFLNAGVGWTLPYCRGTADFSFAGAVHL